MPVCLKKDFSYRIVDETPDYFIIQTACLRTIKKAKLIEIVNDREIITHLPAEQACYLGIRLAIEVKNGNISTNHFTCIIPLTEADDSVVIEYETRDKELFCFNRDTETSVLLDPRNIALNSELLNTFTSRQSFYIGFLSGTLSYSKPLKKSGVAKKPPQLRLVVNNVSRDH
ncbi:MAG: hypothetical protein HKM04_08660 [Legionellales bacterium]|nr:hypothetical protein [Legionellales bacterium]